MASGITCRKGQITILIPLSPGETGKEQPRTLGGFFISHVLASSSEPWFCLVAVPLEAHMVGGLRFRS